MNSMSNFISKTYQLKRLFNVDVENLVEFKPPFETTKIKTNLKLTKQRGIL